MSADASTGSDAWTLSRLLSWTTDYLGNHDVRDARLTAEVLLAHAVGCRRIDLYVRFEEIPDATVRDRFRDLVKRAATHEPTAYLVGRREFFSLTFTVNRSVLVPRPETEVLVETVLDDCAARQQPAPRILDVGTGSGCIPIALLKQLSGATAVGTDISPEALAVAAENASFHEVADRLTLVEADGLDLPAEVREVGFDVLVSNPPYIAEDQLSGLDRNVVDYEPRIALTDGGDGMALYRALAERASEFLRDEARVFVEVAAGMAAGVRRVFEGTALRHVATIEDRVSGHERVVVMERA